MIEELFVLGSALWWTLWAVRWQRRRGKVAGGESLEKVVAVRFAQAGLPGIDVEGVV